MSPAITALVVAIAGIMLPAMAETKKKSNGTKEMHCNCIKTTRAETVWANTVKTLILNDNFLLEKRETTYT